MELPGWQGGRASLVIDEGVTDDTLTGAVVAAGYGAQVVSRIPLKEQVDAVRPGEAEVDLAIIGAGSAAFAAAIRAAELGYSVLMVERGVLGGTCVNVGCVPSKTLLRTAEAFHQATHSRFASVRPQGAELDWAAVIGEKDELVGRMRPAARHDLGKALLFARAIPVDQAAQLILFSLRHRQLAGQGPPREAQARQQQQPECDAD